jgi:hypothetical protein
LNDTVHLLPPRSRSGEEGKRKLLFEFLPATLSPGAHRPDTMADHPPRTCQKTGEGGRALAVAPHGRPAGCSPCSTVQTHSLGPINNSQHSSNREGETGEDRRRGEQKRRRTDEKKKTQKREREEIERRREKERKPRKKKKRGENERERKRRTREKEGTPSRLLTAAPLPPSESYATATSLCRSTASDAQPPPRQVTFLLILAFISFFPSPHAERVAFCMQGWGKIIPPAPFRLGPGGSWPSPVFWAGSGP